MPPLIDRLLAGDLAALARAISLVENDDPAAARLREVAGSGPGRGRLIGITGPPGAGKSTLVDRLVATYLLQGHRVAVIAVDPSSPITGGALLGDRVRFTAEATGNRVFFRSMATRGHRGGLARATADAARLSAAAGFDRVIIETIGVGQADVEVVRVVDICVVVTTPGAGDEVQALKAGIMEIADIFVVNQADRAGADAAVADLEAMMATAAPADRPHSVPVIRTVATTGDGVDHLVAAIERLAGDAAFVSSRPGRAFESHSTPAAPGPGMSGAEVAVLDHAAVALAREDEAVRFFADILGLAVGPSEEVAGQQVSVRFLGQGETRLEIVTPSDPASTVAKFLSRRGPGLHHLAFRVPDLEAALARLRGRGIRLIDDQPRLGAHGRRVVFVHPESACGVLVELVEGEARS